MEKTRRADTAELLISVNRRRTDVLTLWSLRVHDSIWGILLAPTSAMALNRR